MTPAAFSLRELPRITVRARALAARGRTRTPLVRRNGTGAALVQAIRRAALRIRTDAVVE